MTDIRVLLLAASATVLTSGCAGVALTAAGVGGGAMASHQLGGMTYRTFTAPLPRVKGAVLLAFRRMAIKPGKAEKTDLGERILAQVEDREIEVELESLTANVTRMRSIVRRSGQMIMDSATAIEIINQTEKALAPS